MNFILFFLVTLFNFGTNVSSGEWLKIQNQTETQIFEVWVSEGPSTIFHGTLYPKRSVTLDITPGKLYGILDKQLTKNSEKPKVPNKIYDPGKSYWSNGIQYFTAKKGTSIVYELYDQIRP